MEAIPPFCGRGLDPETDLLFGGGGAVSKKLVRFFGFFGWMRPCVLALHPFIIGALPCFIVIALRPCLASLRPSLAITSLNKLYFLCVFVRYSSSKHATKCNNINTSRTFMHCFASLSHFSPKILQKTYLCNYLKINILQIILKKNEKNLIKKLFYTFFVLNLYPLQ